MNIILGGTGHVGSAVAQELLNSGDNVTIISRNPEKADEWARKGAIVAIADVSDLSALHKVFLTGTRLFFLNPPADPSTDTVREEQKSLECIVEALKNTPIEKVVAESTYGAQPGRGNGDLNVLFDMEEKLSKFDFSLSIIRAAYYMSNWDMYLPIVKAEGTLQSMFPSSFKIPMVAPEDIGRIAAKLLKEPVDKSGTYYIEGPKAYSTADVAHAFAKAVGKPVEVISIARSEWIKTMKDAGFSDEAAASYAAMTGVTLDENYEKPEQPIRGATTIQKYIENLVRKADD